MKLREMLIMHYQIREKAVGVERDRFPRAARGRVVLNHGSGRDRRKSVSEVYQVLADKIRGNWFF